MNKEQKTKSNIRKGSLLIAHCSLLAEPEVQP
jgi:hypothetical protein